MKPTYGKTNPEAETKYPRNRRRGLHSPRDRGIEKAKATKPTRKNKASSAEERKRKEIREKEIQKAQKKIKELNDIILADVYWDINLTSYIKTRNEPEDRKAYGVDYIYASEFLDIALSHVDYRHLLGGEPPHPDQNQINRLHEFVRNYGWNILAICAFSRQFRSSVATSGAGEWGCLERSIARNQASLELFAEKRGLGAENLLLEKSIQDEPRPVDKRQTNRDHPHHWVLKTNGTIEPPKYKKKLQEHIDHNIFDPEEWKTCRIKQDPTLRRPKDGRCVICKSPEPCDCVIPSHPYSAVVELRKYTGKGTGVRTLQAIDKGQIIGQFVGELKPTNSEGDLKYSLSHQYFEDEKVMAVIDPHRYGNWTRFVNHSCDSSTLFSPVTVGRCTAMVLVARRKIAPFEEITVDYGDLYLTQLDCKCGTTLCRKQKK